MWCCPKKGWIAPNLGISMQKLMLYTVVYLLTEHSAWDFMVQFSWSQFIIHRLFKLFTCTAKVIGWLDGLLEPKLETKHDKTQQIWIVFMRVSILNHNQSDMTCWKINFIVPFGKLTVCEVEHNYFNRQINQKKWSIFHTSSYVGLLEGFMFPVAAFSLHSRRLINFTGSAR